MAAEKSDRELSPAAFDAAGYLVDQSLVDTSYGRHSTRYNGCGWIAAYNVCHARHCPWDSQYVRQALEKGLWFGGALGTGPLRLRRWLAFALGRRVRFALPRAAGCGPGILFYWTGSAFHYAAYIPKAEGVRLLNAGSDRQEALAPSLEGFLRTAGVGRKAFCLVIC